VQLVVATAGKPLSDADLGTVAALDAAISADPRVASVASLPRLLSGLPPTQRSLQSAAADPAATAALRPFIDVDRGGTVTVIGVLPRTAFDSAEAARLVKDLRTVTRARTQGTDLHVLVGGATAAVVDFTDEINAKTALVLTLVVVLALVVLAVAFRSAVVALVGLIGTMLSVGAAYGALVLVFQQGAGESVLGFTSPGFIQSWLPLLLFATLTGLSTDYQVFLVSRVKEERDAGATPPAAVTEGLRRSGPVILAAATIMIVVFAAFMSATELEIKEMGFALAAVVFIDAVIVRRLMVPAALLLLGNRVWTRRAAPPTTPEKN
jgi:RND superfamily putative drug exporter